MIKAFIAGVLALALGPLAALGMLAAGYWRYKTNEKHIVETMDQYYLTITSPGRERYLLESDETFEVPYMASRLSVDAVPTQILDDQDRVIGEFSVAKGLYVTSPDDLPVFLKRALVASEDGTFYKHHGINWRATVRAFLTDVRHMRITQGGSTITQQLAKMMFTTRKKTASRKIFEMFCARKLEQKFTKDQILLMYLNFAYFGHGAFGVEAASRYYFGKPAKDLTLAEAAMLVGVIPNPRKYSPDENLELAKARHRTVLTRMAKLGFIPSGSVQRISDDFWDEMQRRSRQPKVSFWKMNVNEAPYVVEYVRRDLYRDFTKDRLARGGLKIHTTFDLELQKDAEKALDRGLEEVNAAKRTAKEPPVEGALAAVRPADGAMLALVGGSGFAFSNQLDRAESRRQVGSCIKPFVYAVSIEEGRHKPDDKILDHPLEFKLAGRKTWRPHNYGNKYYGEVTVAEALHKSLNSVAIQILQDEGVGPVIDLLAKATGLPAATFPRNLSLALGTSDASVIDLARAYSVFVNGGHPVEPYYIRYIEDRDGQVLRDDRQRPAPAAPILKPETVRTMLQMMAGVVGPGGSGYFAARKTGFNIPLAAKSGTTNDYRDAWFTGATPDIAASVWMCHDDPRYSIGNGGAGGAVAAPALLEFIKAAYRSRPTKDLDAALGPDVPAAPAASTAAAPGVPGALADRQPGKVRGR